MDLQEATLTMALLMKKESDFYEQHAQQEQSLSRENLKELEWLKANTREFGNRLAANPYFFDVMESWVVTLIGTEGVNKDSMKDAMESADIDDLVDRASVLAASVKSYVRNSGYIVYDMGAGEDGWDLGIRCTDKQSKNLCIELHQRYTQAIEMNLLAISRRFAGHTLPGLHTWEDAKRILIMYGDSLPSLE